MRAAYTGVLCWLSGAPFVLQSLLGLSPLVFSITFSIGAIGYLIGTMIATRIVSRAGIVRVIGYGALLMVLGGLAMCASIALDIGSANILVAAMSIWLVGLGLVFPQALAGGLSCFADRAGAASSLLGFSPQLVRGGCRIAGGGDGRQVRLAAGDRGADGGDGGACFCRCRCAGRCGLRSGQRRPNSRSISQESMPSLRG